MMFRFEYMYYCVLCRGHIMIYKIEIRLKFDLDISAGGTGVQGHLLSAPKSSQVTCS